MWLFEHSYTYGEVSGVLLLRSLSVLEVLLEMAASSPALVAEERNGPSLRLNFSWTLGGSLVFSASHAATMVVLTKVGTPSLVGQFALALAITAPIILLGNMQLATVQATDATRSTPFGEYFGVRLIMTMIALSVIVAISMLGAFDVATRWAIIAVGFAKAAESINDVFYGLFQQYERMDLVAKSMMGKGISSTVALGTGVYLTGNLAIGALAMAICWILLLAVYDLPNGRSLLRNSEKVDCVLLRPVFHLGSFRRLFWLTVPLGIAASLDSLAANLPRYFLQHYFDEEAVGLFAAVSYFMVAGGTIASALARASRPRLARLYYERGPAFQRLALQLIAFGFALGALAVTVSCLIGEPILSAVYTPDYAEHANVLVWIMIGSTMWFMAGFAGSAVTAAQAFGSQVHIHGLSVLGAGIGCWLLIPEYGLIGAAWGMNIGFGVRLATALFFYARMTLDRGATVAN